MNPVAILFLAPSSIKKYVYFVLATLVIILSLPIMAVFALGQAPLSVLTYGVESLVGGDGNDVEVQGLYQGAYIQGTGYDWGNCTYWAATLRRQAAKPIPSTWGNANTWALRARLGGYIVDNTPSPTAIMQTERGNLGHVAYVTAVNPSNGEWTISEMNVKGLDIVDVRTYPASAASQFSFIHDKQSLIPGVPNLIP